MDVNNIFNIWWFVIAIVYFIYGIYINNVIVAIIGVFMLNVLVLLVLIENIDEVRKEIIREIKSQCRGD